MKKIICFQVNTENLEIVFGDVFERDGQMLETYIGADETGFYIVRSRSKVCSIEHFDKNLKLVNSIQLNLKFKKSNRKAECFYLFEDVIYIFYRFDDDKTKKYCLYLEKYDKQSMKQIGEITEISTIDYKQAGRIGSEAFRTSMSKDSTKVLIYCYLRNDKEELERFYTTCYDLETMESWSKVITIPYKVKQISIRDFVIDNDGNIYLVGAMLTTNNSILSFAEIDYYTILAYSNNGEELEEYPIKIQDKTITDIKIDFFDNKDIICAGFFTYDYNLTKSIAGSFYIRLNNETKSIENQSFNDFDIDFIKAYCTEKEIDKIENKVVNGNSVEMENVYLDKMFLREDGAVVLIGEQACSESFNTNTTTSNGYNNDDIIIIAYDSDGENEWNRKIPKKQTSMYRRDLKLSTSSYHSHFKDDKIYVICMLNKENMLLNKDLSQCAEKMEKKDGFLVLCEIDKNGNLKKDCIINIKDTEVLPMPFVSCQISKDESVMYGYTFRNGRLIKFIFE